MWLTSSSIGRKFVMALTGVCLVLFVTFHVLMNTVAVFSPTAYNQICQMLGANWYAVVASMGLAALFIIHIIYAVWLTVQNRKARGEDRYEVTSRPPQVEWSSKNMLVLGVVILAFLVVHMVQFWYKMQFTELVCDDPACWTTVGGAVAAPEFGTLYLQSAFSCLLTPVIYIIAFIALWLHMNHGIWSMFQSCGINNKTWLPRLKSVSKAWTSIVVVLFIIQAITFTYMAREQKFLTNPSLQQQYAEFWEEQAESVIDEYQTATMDVVPAAYNQFMEQQAPAIKQKADFILANFNKQCPTVQSLKIAELKEISSAIAGSAVFDCCTAQQACPEHACAKDACAQQCDEADCGQCADCDPACAAAACADCDKACTGCPKADIN